jgi:hypothetical protein
MIGKPTQHTTGAPSNNEVGGDHYNIMIPPIDYIRANDMSFCEGNVVKYITRYKNKGKMEDLCKCLHYVLLTMEKEYHMSPHATSEIMEILRCYR